MSGEWGMGFDDLLVELKARRRRPVRWRRAVPAEILRGWGFPSPGALVADLRRRGAEVALGADGSIELLATPEEVRERNKAAWGALF